MNEVTNQNLENLSETISQLFGEKTFIEPKHLSDAKILSKTQQWTFRKTGKLNFLQFGKKVLYTRENLRAFFQNAANA